MLFLYISFIVYQSYAFGVPEGSEVNLKYFKNVKAKYSVLNEIHDMVVNFKPIELKSIYKDIPIKNLEIHDNVTKEIMNLHLYSKSNYNLNDMLQNYEKYSIKKGKEKLKSLPDLMSVELKIKTKEFPPIYNITNTFALKAKRHFDIINKKDYTTDIDKEFLVLDTVQIFNDLLYNEEINLLHNVIFKTHNNISKEIIINVNKRLHNELIENKKDDMEYLCLKLHICRPYFGFTDHIVNILRELIKLSDTKLTEFIIKLSIPIKGQSEFFQALMGEIAAIKIGYKIEDIMYRDVTQIRRLFTVMRAYLTKKHLFYQHSNEDANKRRKALRILVDIINKLFDINGDEVMSIHFDLVTSTIINWSRGQNNEIEKSLKNFVDHVVEIMKHNISPQAQLEMKSLIDILIRKHDKTNKVYDYIFVDGSKFMRGEDITSKLSELI